MRNEILWELKVLKKSWTPRIQGVGWGTDLRWLLGLVTLLLILCLCLALWGRWELHLPRIRELGSEQVVTAVSCGP